MKVMQVSEVKREATDINLQKIWLEKIDPKIERKIGKGKSTLTVKAFMDKYSSEKLAKAGRLYGYKVSVSSPTPFSFKNKLVIKW